MFWPLKLFDFRFTVRLSYNFQLKFICYSKILRIGRLFSWERYIAYCVIKRSAIGCKLDKKKLVVALGGRKCYQRYQLNHKKKNFIGTNVQSKKPASVSNLCAFMVYEQNGSITNHISFFDGLCLISNRFCCAEIQRQRETWINLEKYQTKNVKQQ